MMNKKSLAIVIPLLLVLLVVAYLAVTGGFNAAPASNNANTESVSSAPQLISPAAYQEQFAENAEHVLIDVRTPEEFNSGHIAGAINIPVQELPQRLAEVPTGQPVVVYCRSGSRSATAAQILDEAGYEAVYDLGGVIQWTQQGLPLQ